MDGISIVGLSKLGICIASCCASKGYEVIAVDVNKDIVNNVNSGRAPVVEPGLQKMMDSAKQKLRATQDYSEAIRRTDVTFLMTPTPSDPDGHFSDKYLEAALRPLSVELGKSDKKYHLFAIVSTVSPGTINEKLIPVIKRCSGKKLNKDFGVCYNPAFIALGSVIHDFLNPDFVLVGESDTQAGDILLKIHQRVLENKPCKARMSIISSEITKISLNAYVTMKISFANFLANVCERIADADIDSITAALGADRRIGHSYLKGGPAYSGPSFPRDNRAFAAFAHRYGCDAMLAKATDRINNYQVQHLNSLVLEYLKYAAEKRVSLLGLAYKPDTPVIEESPAIKLIDELLRENVKITVYDPLAIDNVRAFYGDQLTYALSMKECILDSSLWIITIPLDEFKALDDSFIAHTPTVIIDCWRMLDKEKLGSDVKYIPLGKYNG